MALFERGKIVMKIRISDVMNDLVSITNQITGLQLLLDSKKEIMKKYFKATGEKSCENDESTCYVIDRAKITYDIPKLEKRLNKKTCNKFVEKRYEITDWEALTKVLKSAKIKPEQIKPYIHVEKTVNQQKLNSLYEKGEINIEELSGCYSCVVNKSVGFRLKSYNTDKFTVGK